MTPKDKLGRDIKVGDYIVHAQRQSSSLWLDVGKVVGVGVKVHWGKVIPFIKARGCRDWSKPELKGRAGEITSLDRVVVVPKEFIPEKYFELLKDLT